MVFNVLHFEMSSTAIQRIIKSWHERMLLEHNTNDILLSPQTWRRVVLAACSVYFGTSVEMPLWFLSLRSVANALSRAKLSFSGMRPSGPLHALSWIIQTLRLQLITDNRQKAERLQWRWTFKYCFACSQRSRWIKSSPSAQLKLYVGGERTCSVFAFKVKLSVEGRKLVELKRHAGRWACASPANVTLPRCVWWATAMRMHRLYTTGVTCELTIYNEQLVTAVTFAHWRSIYSILCRYSFKRIQLVIALFLFKCMLRIVKTSTFSLTLKVRNVERLSVLQGPSSWSTPIWWL